MPFKYTCRKNQNKSKINSKTPKAVLTIHQWKFDQRKETQKFIKRMTAK